MNNPIIVLWSHPRSLSTTLERVMRARGDLTCFHEPFMYYYYEHLRTKEMPFFEADSDHPRGYSEVWSMLQEQAAKSAIFVKDMSYYVYPKICSDSPLQDDLINTFIVRNPLRSIASYHKLDVNVSMDEIGLEAQWNHYSYLESTGNLPVVVEAESIQENPEQALKAYCESAGLEFKPDSLQWDNALTPKAWESVKGWHKDISSSTTVKKTNVLSQSEMEQQFSEYVTSANAPHLYDYLKHHQGFYKLLKATAIAVS